MPVGCGFLNIPSLPSVLVHHQHRVKSKREVPRFSLFSISSHFFHLLSQSIVEGRAASIWRPKSNVAILIYFWRSCLLASVSILVPYTPFHNVHILPTPKNFQSSKMLQETHGKAGPKRTNRAKLVPSKMLSFSFCDSHFFLLLMSGRLTKGC
ncbi:unnamed protein product [Choristocarpus tenellus]